jgi:hypothetical protein
MLPEMPKGNATIMSNTLGKGAPTWYLEILEDRSLQLSIFVYRTWLRIPNPAKIQPGTWHKLQLGWGQEGAWLALDDECVKNKQVAVPDRDLDGSFGFGKIYKPGEANAPVGMQIRVPGLTLGE